MSSLHNNGECVENRITEGYGADPWLFYHNGNYYLTVTGRSVIAVRRSPTLAGMRTAPAKRVFCPEPNLPWSLDLWSPEIHYYSPADFGEELAGWYMFVACCDGSNINHRMYVLRSLDGEPDGQYGNPVTGEPNLPELVTGSGCPAINTVWSVGMTDLRVGNKVYAMWVGEEGRQTESFHQFIQLCKMKTPWQLEGMPGIICTPTEEWECHGYGATQSGKILPRVVEGGTAVYAPDGRIFIIYTGSGYWTPQYAMGQLTYNGGDPLLASSWDKRRDTIFSKSEDICGCGHASYTKAPTGEHIICYHAYIGKNVSSGRFAFIDTYGFTDGGVVIGDGSCHPKPDGTIIQLGNIITEGE